MTHIFKQIFNILACGVVLATIGATALAGTNETNSAIAAAFEALRQGDASQTGALARCLLQAYEGDATPAINNAQAATLASEKNCIFEDAPAARSHVMLAHETVHLLGVGGHSGGLQHLMSTAGTGSAINKAQANSINPSGT